MFHEINNFDAYSGRNIYLQNSLHAELIFIYMLSHRNIRYLHGKVGISLIFNMSSSDRATVSGRYRERPKGYIEIQVSIQTKPKSSSTGEITFKTSNGATYSRRFAGSQLQTHVSPYGYTRAPSISCRSEFIPGVPRSGK